MSELDEIVGEFLVESYENLDRYDEDLLTLERDPADAEAISSIFRAIHTVKGTSGFFGFDRLEALAHVGENLLGRLRDGEIAVTPEITTALLATGDTIRRMLGVIEQTGQEGDEDASEVVETLTRLLDVESTTTASADPDEAPYTEDGAADDAFSGDGVSGDGVADPVKDVARSVSDTSIRVDVGLLDELMNLVGELVLARNQIVQLVTGDQDEDTTSDFAGASQRLNLITTELQEGVMKTRMQPIGNVWNKLPRVVRDLAVTCDKQVDLRMVGQDTELDKTIIEAIKDPLTHLVRNAVDHGIESPAAREAAGKSATGTLELRAFHEGGQVNIEIVDDGGGIDPERIRARALDRGIVTSDQVSRMGEREILNLVFAPGFSTAEAVTNVSGRGVGMDVVRTNIERIGGTVDVQTRVGEGTTFKVKIPLTLAIVPALVVSSAGARYAIPQLSLIELVRLEGEAARTGIERVHGAPVHRLRGRLLPIVDLADELGGATDHERPEVINIIVLHADGQQFGLVVDHIHDTQEIVVKPLGSHLKDATLFAGATIMGDGQVALILDVLGIAQRAQVVTEGRERTTQVDDAVSEGETERLRQTLLLVRLGDDRRAAVALSDVERLEEFDASALEWANGREVVQYRDDILPLLRLGDLLGIHGGPDGSSTIDVVVHRVGDRTVGLIVGDVLDIVDQQVDLSAGSAGSGLLGSAVVQGRVTDVIDPQAIVEAAVPSGLVA